MTFIDWDNPFVKDAPLNRGRIAWWLSGQRSPYWGTATLRDLIGKQHGTLTNGPTWIGALGRPGGSGAIKFDGVNDYCPVGSSSALTFTEMSAACWHRTNSSYTIAQSLLTHSDAGVTANYAFTFGYNDNKYDFWNTADGAHATSTASISTDEWRHVVFTRSGSTGNWTLRIYINGVLDKEQTGVTANPNGTAQAVSIGRFGGYSGYYLDGWIDDVSVWNRPISAGEVWQLYSASRVGYPRELRRLTRRMFLPPDEAVAADAGRLIDGKLVGRGLLGGRLVA